MPFTLRWSEYEAGKVRLLVENIREWRTSCARNSLVRFRRQLAVAFK